MKAMTLYPDRIRAGILCVLGFLLSVLVTQAQSGTWTVRNENGPADALLWSLAEGYGGVVAVGNKGRILQSQDGKTWMLRESGTGVWLVGITFGNGKYVAVGDLGTILTSTDGVAWKAVAQTGTTARLNNVLFAQGRFVAVGERGTLLTSTDGTNWKSTDSGVTGWLHGLAYGGGWWVAVGEAGALTASADGLTWKAQSQSSLKQNLESVVFCEALTSDGYKSATFLAVGSGGVTQQCSVSGYSYSGSTPSVYSWTAWNGPKTTARLSSIAMLNNQYVVTGDNGLVMTASSMNGPWTTVKVGTNKLINTTGFALGSLFLAGEADTIIQSDPVLSSRLANISTRGYSGNGDNVIIAGTIVTGDKPKQFLVRGVGPKLASFGLTSVLADPVLTVYGPDQKVIATSSGGWGTNASPTSIIEAFKRVNAFEFDGGSRDAALLITLNPGSYTFHVSSQSGTPGLTLVETYDMDASAAGGPRLYNISTRGYVGKDASIMIAGLIVQGPTAKTLLIRGVGPTLYASFGLSGILADPVITLFGPDNQPIVTSDNWNEKVSVFGRDITADDIRAATKMSGAFPLVDGGKDAALVITLPPGAYTVHMSGKGGTTGVGLVEAYEVLPSEP